jgi:carbon-monoxide dehydrogenase medium subunit
MLTPSHIVYLGGVRSLDRIEFDERNGLRIGALVRHQELADSPVVRSKYPVLAGMAAHVANPQVRNQGTLGGNLCYGDPATDPPGCLIALRARVSVVGGQGERTIELDEFFTDYYQTALQPDEVVTEIQVPPMAAGAKGAYTRFLRTPAEHRPLVSVAVVARGNREVRIAIGASVPVPTRARRAEQFLEGRNVTRDVLEEAAAIAAADVEPVSDFRGSAQYRRDMIRTVVRRTAATVFGL